jgi:hypothetical protein
MRYVVTERQLKLLVEQPESRFGPEQFMSHSERQDFHSGNSEKAGAALMSGSKKQMDYVHSIDPHTVMTIAAFGTAFIPLVGPFISSGIAMADAAMYYKQGDTKTAGLVGLFSLIPVIGGLAAKLGLGQVTSKIMSEIAKKISFGGKFSAAEVQIVNKVAQYRNLIQQEITKLSAKAGVKAGVKAGINTAKHNVKKRLVRKAVANKTKKVLGKTANFAGTKVAPYVGAAAAYNKGYDAITGTKAAPSLEDLVKVDIQNISQTNLQASKELDF